MLENEDEREEVDEPSQAERSSRAIPPPELRPLPWLLDQSCPLGGVLRHTSTQCAVTPAVVVVVATPTIFAPTPTVGVPAIVIVAASLFPPVSFCQLFLRESAKRQGRGPLRGLSAGP